MLVILSNTRVKTAKPHKCFGCAREFPKHTVMERTAVKDGKSVFTVYLCETCQEVQEETMQPGDTYCLGDLREAALRLEADKAVCEEEHKIREGEKMGKRLVGVEHCRSEILRTAVELIDGERDASYGDPDKQYECTAGLWEAYLRGRGMAVNITPHDALVMMGLLKVSRMACGAAHEDNYVDAAGYIALAGEVKGIERGTVDPKTHAKYPKDLTPAAAKDSK